MRKIKIVDYDQMNLTWNIDVLYKNQYILTLILEELDEFSGLLAVALWPLDDKYAIEISPGNCDSKYPFEVNCHLYNAQKLNSLRALLIKQHDPYLDTLVVATERYENEHELPILKNSASSNQEFEEYLQYLNNDENVLKFILKELNVEKVIDLKFIKNIELIYDKYIESLNEELSQLQPYYKDAECPTARQLRETLAFKTKYEKILQVVNNQKAE